MISGDTTDWDDLFQRTLIPTVFDCVVAAWASLATPGPTDKERKIALALYCELSKVKNRSRLPFRFGFEVVEVDTVAVEEKGRKDIVVYPRESDLEEIYFCLEAKRLNVTNNGRFSSLATKYVTEGMQRYVDGKYANAVLHGAMVGFVMDGKLKNARKKVGAKIKKNRTQLGMSAQGGLTASSIRPGDKAFKETFHKRTTDSKSFCIHHVFLAVA